MTETGRQPLAATVVVSKSERLLRNRTRINFRDGVWLGDRGYQCKR
jgi:hypothetical protein